MAIDLSRPKADVSMYVNDARGVSHSHQLDFLDFVGNDGSIISSTEWSARFGYKMDWVTQPTDWASLGSFLMKVDTQDGPALGIDGGFRRARGRQEPLRSGRRAAREGISFFARSARRDARSSLFESRSEFSIGESCGRVRSGIASRALRILSSRHRSHSRANRLSRFPGRPIPRTRKHFTRCRCSVAKKSCSGCCWSAVRNAKMVMLDRRIQGLAIGVAAMGLFLGHDAELVGSGARYAPGSQTGRRRTRSFGRELERARGRSRPQRNSASFRARSIA